MRLTVPIGIFRVPRPTESEQSVIQAHSANLFLGFEVTFRIIVLLIPLAFTLVRR